MPYTRRDFLKHGALFVALGLTAPAFLARAALASDQPMSQALRAAGLPLPGRRPIRRTRSSSYSLVAAMMG